MPIKFCVAVEDTERIKKLENDLASARSELMDFQRKYNDLEYKYISEIQINCECVDLLNSNGITFRKNLSRKDRYSR